MEKNITIVLVAIDEKAMKRKFIRDKDLTILDSVDIEKDDLLKVLKFNHKFFDVSKEFEYSSNHKSDDAKHYCFLRPQKFEKIKKKITKSIYQSLLINVSDDNTEEIEGTALSSFGHLSTFIDIVLNSKDSVYIWVDGINEDSINKNKESKKDKLIDDDFDLEKEDDEL